jgi:hypothetical protein
MLHFTLNNCSSPEGDPTHPSLSSAYVVKVHAQPRSECSPLLANILLVLLLLLLLGLLWVAVPLLRLLLLPVCWTLLLVLVLLQQLILVLLLKLRNFIITIRRYAMCCGTPAAAGVASFCRCSWWWYLKLQVVLLQVQDKDGSNRIWACMQKSSCRQRSYGCCAWE